MRFRSCLVLLLLISAGGPAVNASPNGLNQIPIAKVYGDGGVALSFSQADLGTPSTVLTTQYGLYNIGEVGIDYQAAPASQREVLANAKILLFHKPGNLPDVAAGIENIGTWQRAVPYMVATTQPQSLGFSLGVIRPVLNGYEAMGGISYNVSPTFQVVADTIRGWSNYTTLGVIDNVTPSIQANLAYAAPNQSMGGQNPNGYIFNVTYLFHIKGGGVSHGKDLSTKGGIIPTGPVKPAPGAAGNGGGTNSGSSSATPGGK